jgi:hypothetical protein
MLQKMQYTAHIAGNLYSKEFDTANGKTPESAAAAVKRKNSPDWKDCCIWVTSKDGYHETVYDGSK